MRRSDVLLLAVPAIAALLAKKWWEGQTGPEDDGRRWAAVIEEVEHWVDAVRARCEVEGWPLGDERSDLEVLCKGGRPLALSEGFQMFKNIFYPGTRFAGKPSYLLFAPSPDSDICSCLTQAVDAQACPVEPFLNLIVVHHPAIQPYGVLQADWLAAEVFSGLARPLRVLPVVAGPGGELPDVPALDNSLFLVESGDQGQGAPPDVDLRALAGRARAGGARNLGLVHVNHEVLWDVEGTEDFDKLVSVTRGGSPLVARHCLEEYSHFDYVLRNYYSPAYSARSHYIPLGTKDGSWLPAHPLEVMEHWNYSFLPQSPESTPKASTRSTFCIGTFGKMQDPTGQGGWYKWDRGDLLEVLSADPGLCSVSSAWKVENKKRLLDSAVSLCPFGSNQETYRLWESVLAGSLVVTTRAAFIQQELRAPFIVLDKWSDLAPRLAELRGEPERLDELQRQQTAWYVAYMSDLRARVRRVTSGARAAPG